MKLNLLESDIDSNPCSSEADDEIASRVDDELTFEYTVDGRAPKSIFIC